MSAPVALGISGSPSPDSRSRRLVARLLERLAANGAATDLLDLLDLPAEALLARRRDPATAAAVARAQAADILILGTPIYRATYAGQLKAFFDLFPPEALRGRVAGLVATGAGPAHLLALDHGLRPLVASLGGLTAARGVYVTDADLPSGTAIPDALDATLASLADELRALAGAQMVLRGATS